MPACYTAKDFDKFLGTTRKPTQHRVALWRYAAQRVGQQEADDCLSKALIVAWQAIPRFNADDGAGAFLNFLRRYVTFACDDFLRRRSRRHLIAPETLKPIPEVQNDIDDIGYFVSFPLQQAYIEELRALLEVVRLTPRQSDCIHAWLDGLTMAEIGSRFHIREQTVWEHIVAGRRKLAQWADNARLQILEALNEEMSRTIYRAPTTTGAALAREALAALDALDARHTALCRRAQLTRLYGHHLTRAENLEIHADVARSMRAAVDPGELP